MNEFLFKKRPNLIHPNLIDKQVKKKMVIALSCHCHQGPRYLFTHASPDPYTSLDPLLLKQPINSEKADEERGEPYHHFHLIKALHGL